MPANSRRIFANAAPDPVAPEDVQLAERVRDTYDRLLADPRIKRRVLRTSRGHRWYHATRQDNSTSALYRVGLDTIDVRNAGAPESTILIVEDFARALRQDLYCGAETRSRDVLDLDEGRRQASEDHHVLLARINPSPETLRAAADAMEAEAALEIERARAYRIEARRLELARLRGTPELVA